MIITEAELKADKMIDKNLCNRCGKCVKACPADALTGWEERYNRLKINKQKRDYPKIILLDSPL
ncbi:MAG: 4Fe-4S binding domain [Clostridia bacterium]|nr:4Fe-4S binding domain [Clostridia bacterium]